MFENFLIENIDVGETTLFLRRAGSGSPLLLLHGFPQTHLMWREVGPDLARSFTVICADLRGIRAQWLSYLDAGSRAVCEARDGGRYG